MDLSKIDSRKWILVWTTDPTKNDGYVSFDKFVKDVFVSKLNKTKRGYEKTVEKRPIENRKYFSFDEVNITAEQLNSIL